MSQDVVIVDEGTPVQAEQWVPSNLLSREVREEMKALSVEVFGKANKWKELVDQGTMIKATRKALVKEKQKDGTELEVERDVLAHNEHGQPYSYRKNYCVGELKALMIDAKEKVAAMNDQLAQQQLEAAKAKTESDRAKEIHESAGGHAL